MFVLLSVIWRICDKCLILRIFNTETQLILVLIVQIPDTFFENNNRDEIAISDDLDKMMFPPFELTPENVHKIEFFMPHPVFPITAQSVIEAMSSNIHSD